MTTPERNGLHRTALRARDILSIAALVMLANSTVVPAIQRHYVIEPVMAQVSAKIGEEIAHQMQTYTDSLAKVVHAEGVVQFKADSVLIETVKRGTYSRAEIDAMRVLWFRRQDSLHSDLVHRFEERRRGR